VHLVCFNTKKFVMMHGHMNVKIVKYVGGTLNDQYEITRVKWKWLIEALSRNFPVMFEEDHETSNLG